MSGYSFIDSQAVMDANALFRRCVNPYLTDAASWYMLTMVTEVFGVSWQFGGLEGKASPCPSPERRCAFPM